MKALNNSANKVYFCIELLGVNDLNLFCVFEDGTMASIIVQIELTAEVSVESNITFYFIVPTKTHAMLNKGRIQQ